MQMEIQTEMMVEVFVKNMVKERKFCSVPDPRAKVFLLVLL